MFHRSPTPPSSGRTTQKSRTLLGAVPLECRSLPSISISLPQTEVLGYGHGIILIPLHERELPMTRPLDRLLAIMARLRDPERGCPWDRVQDFSTIAPCTIEEAYEV